MPPDVVQPQRWKRRKAARPQEILDAAMSVFAAKGYAGTRMEDIAHEAGITKGTIYLYFENKEAVLKALVRDSIGSTIDQLAGQVQAFEGSTPDLLRFVLTAMAQFIVTSDRVVLPKIVVAEAGNFPELARFYRDEIIDKGLGLLSAVIARGSARGEFRAVVPGHVARLCIAPLLLAAIWRTTFAQFDAAPYDYQGLTETHIETLLRGLAAEGTPT
ncbi:MAG: TetR/AcrR family transcriptional regulator [Alphaproteobacteria bacterium]|nr:TetR/AcrR family transcriptional regulator [Alphaproteobacteria bacterium]MBU6471228.1 TetR/AcrR family transcriptional regulator [Alphaproteobacteria bacterium]MDE2011444.1 TetR/AcrR family transcriptional regulator [Alphaproteobacteria bacterium]MDE2071835.1 TetR/AcrR family transcriptional regulator [Alphaproteobacteria bacterium]MDE2350492.1 TetR/AcrR family transcriptional regulator [Alphaproteobacteria bacterium]